MRRDLICRPSISAKPWRDDFGMNEINQTNTGELIFRRIIENDIPQILAISEESKLSRWTAEGYKNELRNSEFFGVVCERKKEIIGFLAARLIIPVKCAELFNIAVRASHRNQSIGKELVNKLYNSCILNSLDKILLEVRQSNATAINFYRREEFKIIGTRKNFYTNPPESAFSMALDITLVDSTD